MRSSIIPWRRSRQPGLSLSDQPLSEFDRDFGGMFEKFFDTSSYLPSRFFNNGDTGFGAIDMAEKDNTFLVTMDLPGVEEADIGLELSGNRLSVHAKRERKSEEDIDGFHQVERAFGADTRQLMLPDEVDADKTVTDFKDGVLSITLPKSDTAKQRTRKNPLKH